MLKLNPQYLVNDKGEKTNVLISINEYQLLMQRLEDLEDSLEMDAAVQTETEFRDYQDIRADLIKEGKFWAIQRFIPSAQHGVQNENYDAYPKML